MPCPVCQRVMCDHTPEQRGQTPEVVMRVYEADVEKIQKEQKAREEKKN